MQQRIMYARGKQEERSMIDLKRDHSIAVEQLKHNLSEKTEELDYLNKKVAKLETQNKELILQKDSKGEIKKLEAQITLL